MRLNLIAVVVLGAAHVTSGNLRGEDPLHTLLRGLSHQTIDSATVGDVRSCDFVMETGRRPHHLQFEFVIFGPLKNRPNDDRRYLVRSILQPDERHSAWVWQGNLSLPNAVVCDRRSIPFYPNGWKSNTTDGFAFVVDRSHVVDHADLDCKPPDRSGYVKFALGSFLTGFFRDETPDTRWDSRSRVIEAVKANGSRVAIRFRSPNDELRYGTALGEMRADGLNFFACYRGFLAKHHSRHWINTGNGDHLAARIGELNREKASDEEFGGMLTYVPRGEVRGWRMARYIYPPLTDPSVGLAAHASLQSAVDFRTRLTRTVANVDRGLQPQASPSKHDLEALAAMSSESLRTAVAAIGDYVHESDTLPDDPAMLAREMEMLIGPAELYVLHVLGARWLLKQAELPEESRFALLHALGMSGSLPAGVIVHDPELMKTDPVADAILRAHWQWTCDDRHFETCVKTLDAALPGSAREAVAIESLARLDAVARIPAEVMNRWFTDNVVNNPGARRRVLTLLSLQPSGRAFLVDWLQAAAGNQELAETRGAVVRTFHARANATLQTERYDFMTPEESRRLLQLTHPE
jgi:hypothetical protein